MARTILEHLKHEKYPRLKIQLRARSRYYQAVTFIDGRKAQQSLKTTDPVTALKLGETWYKRVLRASVAEASRHPIDRLATDPTIGEVFAAFRLTLPKPKRPYVDTKWGAVGPFWRAILVTAVTPQLFRQFYKERRRHKTQYGAVPTNGTLAKDAILIRQVLNHAIEEGHLQQLPLIPKPGKIVANPRPWLTPDEWQHLVTMAETRLAQAAERRQERVVEQRIDLLAFMQLMVATMCRVGELQNLRYCDCQIDPKTTILTAQVTGKRGTRTIKAPASAGRIVLQRQKGLGNKPDLMQRIFIVHHREGFKELLKAAKLYRDNQGFSRNLKSLRATAISFRILEGRPTPNLLAIARNAGTSVSMIDQFYARRMAAELFTDALTSSLNAVVGDSLD